MYNRIQFNTIDIKEVMEVSENLLKVEFSNYWTTGKISSKLYKELVRIVSIVLKSQGIFNEDIHKEITSDFFLRILKYKENFYLKLKIYH